MKKAATFGLLSLMVLLGGCFSQSVENTPQTSLETGNTLTLETGNVVSTGSMSGDNSLSTIIPILYCTTSIDECIHKNKRESLGLSGFSGPIISGFIFSGQATGPITANDKPLGNNSSTIYFNNNSNTAEDTTYNGTHTIEGKIMKGVESIEVIWDGDNESFFLKKFTPKTSDFSYNINNTFGNIKPGENRYLIRGYQSPNIIFERIYTLYYITGGQDIVLKEVKQIPPMDSYRYCELGYGNYMKDINEKNRYLLGISPYTLANQVLKLQGGEVIIYKNKYTKKNDYGEIIIQNEKGKTSNTVQYRLGCEEMGGSSIQLYSGGYFSIYQSYFEGVNDTLIYIPQNNKLISINENLLKPLSKKQFYGIYSYAIQGDIITITEHPYCCDNIENPGGYEEFTFNLVTQKFISKKKLSQSKN